MSSRFTLEVFPLFTRRTSFRIDVWFCILPMTRECVVEAEAVLSAAEIERAGRMRSDRDRDRYVLRHGALRHLLGYYIECSPRNVRIERGVHGKPCLADSGHIGEIHFSMAHSAGVAAYAVSAIDPIGVDIEWVRPLPDLENLVGLTFAPREQEEYQATPGYLRLERFYRGWVRKEAVMKASGLGLSLLPSAIDLSGPAGTKVPVASPSCRKERHHTSHSWHVQDVEALPGFAAAVASAGNQWGVRCFTMNWSSAGDIHCRRVSAAREA